MLTHKRRETQGKIARCFSTVVLPPPRVCAFSFLYHIHVLTFWAFSFQVFLSNTALVNDGLSYREQKFWLKEGQQSALIHNSGSEL